MKRRGLLWLLPFSFGLLSSCKRDASLNHPPSSQPITQAEMIAAKGSDTTPHCEALSLVWNTQQTLIRAIESAHANSERQKQKEQSSAEGRWWFDCDSRQWEVKRPFGPGFIDSTHWFNVEYKINGQALATWFVDTRKKTVKVSTNTLDQKSAT